MTYEEVHELAKRIKRDPSTATKYEAETLAIMVCDFMIDWPAIKKRWYGDDVAAAEAGSKRTLHVPCEP